MPGFRLDVFALLMFCGCGASEGRPVEQSSGGSEPSSQSQSDSELEAALMSEMAADSAAAAQEPVLQPLPVTPPEQPISDTEIRQAICDVSLPAADPRPSAQTLQSLVCGTNSVADIIDPRRGVLLIVARQDTPEGHIDGGPELRRAQRLCGDALETFTREFADAFLMDVVNHVDGLPAQTFIQCDDWQCQLPAHTEWETEDRLVFSEHRARGMVLTTVVQLETLLVEPSLAQARTDWAAEQQRALSRGRCR